MQEGKANEVVMDTVLELSLLKDQLLSLAGGIKCVMPALDSAIQILKNRSTQNDTHVCKCQKKSCKEQTSTSGESTEINDRHLQGHAQTVITLLEASGYVGPFTVTKSSRTIK